MVLVVLVFFSIPLFPSWVNSNHHRQKTRSLSGEQYPWPLHVLSLCHCTLFSFSDYATRTALLRQQPSFVRCSILPPHTWLLGMCVSHTHKILSFFPFFHHYPLDGVLASFLTSKHLVLVYFTLFSTTPTQIPLMERLLFLCSDSMWQIDRNKQP